MRPAREDPTLQSLGMRESGQGILAPAYWIVRRHRLKLGEPPLVEGAAIAVVAAPDKTTRRKRRMLQNNSAVKLWVVSEILAIDGVPISRVPPSPSCVVRGNAANHSGWYRSSDPEAAGGEEDFSPREVRQVFADLDVFKSTAHNTTSPPEKPEVPHGGPVEDW